MANTQLQRVRLNSGGYDSSGSYWGHGQPLFYFMFDDGGKIESGTLRASDRNAAKEKVRTFNLSHIPNIVFYR
jgi:hypothetical protein